MEVTGVNCQGTSFSFVELKKDKTEFKRNVDFFENSTKEVMSVFEAESVQITRGLRQEENRSVPFKDAKRMRLTLKVLKEKKYPFPSLDCQACLMIFLKKGSFNS